MSAERTLMSWLRTSLAMIGFGFTLAKFLDQLASAGGADCHPEERRRRGISAVRDAEIPRPDQVRGRLFGSE